MNKGLRIFLILVLVIALCAGAGLLGWRWYDANVDRSGWVEEEGRTYYKDFHGKPVTGWQEIDGNRYYFGKSTALATGWLHLDDGSYYLQADGTPAVSWQEIDSARYYFGEDGRRASGWQEIDGNRHFFDDQGVLATGWLDNGGSRYYLSDAGTPVTGWQELEDGMRYFQENGAMTTGWAELNGQRYYFTENGTFSTGWIDIDSVRYHFNADGTMSTGWMHEGEYSYYLKEDGTMAVGPTEIDGKTYHFSPHGVQILLVNPWNYVPEDYEVDLVVIESGFRVAEICYEPLKQMLADCKAAGHFPTIISGYRTVYDQQALFREKQEQYMRSGYSSGAARANASQIVAVPGTSEHQLGLAVDIVTPGNRTLNKSQSSTKTQQWLMEHCWEYGFILRYPEDASDITGIIYEPWHYRYVGLEIALELRDLGITLEEYLGTA